LHECCLRSSASTHVYWYSTVISLCLLLNNARDFALDVSGATWFLFHFDCYLPLTL
jgi:hypothetical protein